MLVQQIARQLHNSKAPRVLLKLDIARAFDSVLWPFLLEILQHLEFGLRWLAWVSILLATSSTRVLINGTPGPPVDHARGLRQGDPLLPMMFVLVIDALNSMVQYTVQHGILQRLTTRQAASSISLFAVDVVIFCHPVDSNLQAVRTILRSFGAASGLITNFDKCSATPIRCTPQDFERVGTTLSCPVTSFLITYLGLPLSVRKVPVSPLLPLVEKMAKRLGTCQASLLSRGERLALVRHVLSAMPVHILLATALSPPILKLVTHIIRDFLWHGRREARAGSCLVKLAQGMPAP